jgi:hypothetical protein
VTRKSSHPTSWTLIGAIAIGVGAMSASRASAAAQKTPARLDGLYDFQAKPHTGTLAVKSVKGGIVFDVTTVSPKGATCSASGKAIGGNVLTFREEEAGFRLTILRDQITISGLLGRVSETPFCGLNALVTGVYKRRGALDAETAALLAAIEKPPPRPTAAPPSAKAR